jgi:hypothetical protein
MSNDFEQVQNREEVTPIMDGYLMECCDCGLVHRMTFRAVKVLDHLPDGTWGYEELDPKEYRVVFTAERTHVQRQAEAVQVVGDKLARQ